MDNLVAVALQEYNSSTHIDEQEIISNFRQSSYEGKDWRPLCILWGFPVAQNLQAKNLPASAEDGFDS